MMGLSNQFPIGQRSSADDPLQGVLEDVGVVPVVEPPLQLLQVTVEMLDAHFVKGADDGPLEQTPHAFNRVGVNVPDDPFLGGMAHSFMAGVSVSDSNVGLQFVGVDGLGLVPDVALDEAVQGVAADVGDALDPDLSGFALDGTGHPGLAFFAPRADVAPFATDQGFIHFDHPEQSGSGEGIVPHGLADAVAQMPGRLIAGPQKPLELIGRNSFAGLAHQIGRGEPLAERQVGIVHNGPGGHGEMVITPPAIPLAPVLNWGDFHITAPGAGDPVRPSQFLQPLTALFVTIKTIKQGDEIHGSVLQEAQEA